MNKHEIFQTVNLGIQNNQTTTAILLYVIIFYCVQYIKPAWLYAADGSVRSFGVGYKEKTVIPLWLFAFILGILSYAVVINI